MGRTRSSLFLGNTLIGLKRKNCNDFFNEFKFIVKQNFKKIGPMMTYG